MGSSDSNNRSLHQENLSGLSLTGKTWTTSTDTCWQLLLVLESRPVQHIMVRTKALKINTKSTLHLAIVSPHTAHIPSTAKIRKSDGNDLILWETIWQKHGNSIKEKYLLSVLHVIDPIMNHELDPRASKHVELLPSVHKLVPWEQLRSYYWWMRIH